MNLETLLAFGDAPLLALIAFYMYRLDKAQTKLIERIDTIVKYAVRAVEANGG